MAMLLILKIFQNIEKDFITFVHGMSRDDRVKREEFVYFPGSPAF